MATANRITITTPEIRQADFKYLVKDLVANSIEEDSSPFHKVRRILKEELENDSTLDNAQKVGVLAGFLKDTYADINKQAMATAMELMKTNEQLKLEKYKVESEYNKMQQDWVNGQEVQLGLAKDNLLKDKELELAQEKIHGQTLTNYEIRAKLKKQWGVTEGMSVSYGVDGQNVVSIVDVSGTTRFYKANNAGEMLANQATVDATAGAEYGVLTTDNVANAEMVSGTNAVLTTTLSNTASPGAVDKQIVGYDKVNQKDLIKTYNELFGMISNAQIDVPDWIGQSIAVLSNRVEAGSTPTKEEMIALQAAAHAANGA